MSLVKIVLGEIFNLVNHDLHPLLVGVVLLPMLESKSDNCCLFIAKCVARSVFKLNASQFHQPSCFSSEARNLYSVILCIHVYMYQANKLGTLAGHFDKSKCHASVPRTYWNWISSNTFLPTCHHSCDCQDVIFSKGSRGCLVLIVL